MDQILSTTGGITAPPPELIEQWVAEACPECRLTYDEFTGESVEILVTRAAQWGAEQRALEQLDD
jgi:hypothetical protein